MSPRIRSVHPDICTSEVMAGLPADLERTFVRLWTHCDDEGRCVDNALLIKAAIYPLHEEVSADVLDDDLGSLSRAGLIVRYKVDGRRYLAICSWEEYQHPQRGRESKYPPPPAPSRTPPRGVADVYVPGVGEGEGEGEGVGEGVAPNESSRNQVRALRDLLFEAVADACGWDWRKLTKVERGKLNGAVGQLRDIGADPSEVPLHAINYRLHMPDCLLTPPALAAHWGLTSHPPATRLNGAQRELASWSLEDPA